jgi:hypothetical protein
MNVKNKSKKGKAEFDKAIVVSVTKEMARPRMTESARIELDKRFKSRDGVSACSDSPLTAIVQHLRRDHFSVKIPTNC